MVLGLVALAVLTPLTQGPSLRIAMATMGAAAVVVGLTLMSNFKGAAEYYSAESKKKSRLGIDYSDYVLLEPRFVRAGGILFVLLGLFFTVGAFTGPV